MSEVWRLRCFQHFGPTTNEKMYSFSELSLRVIELRLYVISSTVIPYS